MLPPLLLASPETAQAFLQQLDLSDAVRLPASQSMRPKGLAAQAATLRMPLAKAFDAVTETNVSAIHTTSASGSDQAGLGVQPGIEQSFLVGNQIMSFNAEVTAERRAAAINSCLLAQLRASKLYPSPATAEAAQAWHAAYINTLTNVGWVLQGGITEHEQAGTTNASVDQVVLQIASALLTGAAGAALIAKIIGAISASKKDDPFIVIYQSRTVEQNVVEFAAGLYSGQDTGFLLSVLECAIQVQSEDQQILFFRWESNSASVEGRRFDLAISDSVYSKVATIIEQKIAAYVQSFVNSIDLPPPS